jgi:hypothetical protein
LEGNRDSARRFWNNSFLDILHETDDSPVLGLQDTLFQFAQKAAREYPSAEENVQNRFEDFVTDNFPEQESARNTLDVLRDADSLTDSLESRIKHTFKRNKWQGKSARSSAYWDRVFYENTGFEWPLETIKAKIEDSLNSTSFRSHNAAITVLDELGEEVLERFTQYEQVNLLFQLSRAAGGLIKQSGDSHKAIDIVTEGMETQWSPFDALSNTLSNSELGKQDLWQERNVLCNAVQLLGNSDRRQVAKELIEVAGEDYDPSILIGELDDLKTIDDEEIRQLARDLRDQIVGATTSDSTSNENNEN